MINDPSLQASKGDIIIIKAEREGLITAERELCSKSGVWTVGISLLRDLQSRETRLAPTMPQKRLLPLPLSLGGGDMATREIRTDKRHGVLKKGRGKRGERKG